ncbi:MAG: signal peptidase II [Firmicutes bacterium]|nr:signal peptidase II [Bacillota bacterium]
MYYIIAAILLTIDQGIKCLVISGMDPGEKIPVIGEFFRIAYTQNTGIAFSLFEDKGFLLILIPATISVVCAVVLARTKGKTHPVLNWGLALVLAGGIGNVIDRLVHGYVVDYLSFGSFAIFNFADVCICTGCGLILLYVLFIYGKKDAPKA